MTHKTNRKSEEDPIPQGDGPGIKAVNPHHKIPENVTSRMLPEEQPDWAPWNGEWSSPIRKAKRSIHNGWTLWVIMRAPGVDGAYMGPSPYQWLSGKKTESTKSNRKYTTKLDDAALFDEWRHVKKMANNLTRYSNGRYFYWPVPLPAARILAGPMQAGLTSNLFKGVPKGAAEESTWLEHRNELLEALHDYDDFVFSERDPEGEVWEAEGVRSRLGDALWRMWRMWAKPMAPRRPWSGRWRPPWARLEND